MSSKGGSSNSGQRTRGVVLDLSKYVDSEVHVKFLGGRQGRFPMELSCGFTNWVVLYAKVRGILKGWDPLVNIVLDEAIEEVRGE